MAGDKQCLSIPIIDNSIADGDREFTAALITLDPFVRIEPGQENSTIFIIDDDSKNMTYQLPT